MSPTIRRCCALCFVLAVVFQTACAYERLPNGVVFRLAPDNASGAKLLKIELCTAGIVHVTATADTLSTRASLMVNRKVAGPVEWSVREAGGFVDITTPRITIRVNPKTGAVTFLDAGGKLLLKEKDHGKVFTPALVLGEQTFHVQQMFDSPDEEGFYGLGGHQQGVMNYRGHDIDLWQHNMEQFIPFLVSTRHYGILWENTSRTKFGDIRDYRPISDLQLTDVGGHRGGLTAEYFKDSLFHDAGLVRAESTIAYDFIDLHNPYPEGFPDRLKSVRWSGEISSRENGVHKLRLYSSGYVRLWLDGNLVVDTWRQSWLPWPRFVALPMTAGRGYPITLEWIPGGGFIGLSCLPPEEPVYRNSLSMYSEVADQIDYYFVYGKTPDEIIGGYRWLTGRAPMMPRWAMGFWQSREHYASSDDLLSTVREFRKRNIPLDNIVQDWFYWKENAWGSQEFDSTRYPDPAALIRTLHDSLHARFMISVWAKYYTGVKNYEDMARNGWLYTRNIEKGQRDWVGPGYVSTFYDAYSPGARALFWKQINSTLFGIGVDAWWLDCTEPDICSNLSFDETVLRQHPTALGTGRRYLNAFSLMQTDAVYGGQRAVSPDQRVFILTRSAFAGTQRNAAATWSGDLASRWYDLRAQISSGVNFCMSGIPYWTTDIGGFAVESRYEHPGPSDRDEWRELNTRWYQFGAFCPLFRSHGQFPLREVYNVAPDGHPAYSAMVAYDRLRYRLMPYIYTLAGMVTHDDYTIMRGLVMDFPNDKNVRAINDQFMFGPALLVNPVTEYKARSRRVYLPKGGWYTLRDGEYVHGGRTVVAPAPYEEIPVYARAGSIIPTGPAIAYTGERPADPIRLFVYTGASGSFSLYEDDGTTYQYEKGAFSRIPLTYDDASGTLMIGTREGSFSGMLGSRRFDVVWVSEGAARSIGDDRRPDTSIVYGGKGLSVRRNK